MKFNELISLYGSVGSSWSSGNTLNDGWIIGLNGELPSEAIVKPTCPFEYLCLVSSLLTMRHTHESRHTGACTAATGPRVDLPGHLAIIPDCLLSACLSDP